MKIRRVRCIAVILALLFVSVSGLQVRTASAQNVNAFVFSAFEANYYLSKDDQNRSTMRVVERLTAEFPDYNQNKGIVRAIPQVYDGHSVSPKIVSLTRNGKTEPIYSQYTQNNNLVVETGTDDYVRGTQTYELTYTLRDVVKDFGDHQELYWDTNGTEWRQSFGKVTAHVHVDTALQADFQQRINCYKGVSGGDASCDTEVANKAGARFESYSLGAGENMTLVMAFDAGTFAPYEKTFMERIVMLVPISVLGLIIVIMGIIITLRFTKGRGAPGKGTIVPQYLPPENVSILAAAQIIKKPKASFAAQYIDLAVRHKIRIIEVDPKSEAKGFFAKMLAPKKSYSLELIALDGLGQDERKVIAALFGSAGPGARYDIKAADYVLVAKLGALHKEIHKLAEGERAYFRPIKKLRVALILLALLSMVLGVVQLVIVLNITDQGLAPFAAVVTMLIGVTAGILTIVRASTLYPLSEKGKELEEYLRGLKDYISMAEADRLKALQSPEGATKTKVNTNDSEQIVKLYERVLPYAVLFGQEKEWVKQLGEYYEQQASQPDWYTGTGVFHGAAFASALGGFSTSATSFSSPASSSSSGMSGGSSGGGGGGGGGGGR